MGKVSRVELWRGSDGKCEQGKIVSTGAEEWDVSALIQERIRSKHRQNREKRKQWSKELNYISGVGSESNNWWMEGVYTGGVRVFSDGSVKEDLEVSSYGWEAWRKKISTGKWHRVAWGGGDKRGGQ